MKNKYKIGEVSKLLGISPDTIRLYESKNIVRPSKNPETNYRYYSIYDIYNLIDSIFYRKINISLDDISDLIWSSSYEDIKKIINYKELDIKNELEKQRIYLKKLNRIKKCFNLIDTYLDKPCILPFKKKYILCELDANHYKNILSLNKETFDLYNFSSKVYIANNTLAQIKHYLTIEETDIIDFNLENVLNPKKYLQYKGCVYAVIKINYDNLSISDFKHILEYVSKKNINTESYIFTNYLFRTLENKNYIDYLEIFYLLCK